jgi:phage baseplate assembly protein V
MTASHISALYTRMLNVIGRGRVKLVDETKVIQTLQVVFNEELETHAKLYSAGHYGFASALPVDTDIVAVFIAGDRTNGIAIASNHQDSRPKNMAQGEVMLFDDQGTKIWLKRSGIVIEAGGRPVEIDNASTLTIKTTGKIRLETPTLEVTGEIIDNAGSNTKTMKNLRDAYNIHKHTGVQTGSGTSGPTDTPS